jgi:excisionase family DNA binding protein
MKADVRLTKAFYSPGEVAEMLGLHADTILNYVHAGRLAAIQLSARTYRIPQREVRRLIAPKTLTPPKIVVRVRGGKAAAAALRARLRHEPKSHG